MCCIEIYSSDRSPSASTSMAWMRLMNAHRFAAKTLPPVVPASSISLLLAPCCAAIAGISSCTNSDWLACSRHHVATAISAHHRGLPSACERFFQFFDFALTAAWNTDQQPLSTLSR